MIYLSNIQEFQLWINTAAPGSCACYFTGTSVADEAETLNRAGDPALLRFKKMLCSSYESGHVYLTQRRRVERNEKGWPLYDYLVTRSSKVTPLGFSNLTRALIRDQECTLNRNRAAHGSA